MPMHIFISRLLAPESILLHQPNWQVQHQSLLQLKPLKFGLPLEMNWIFFSSQNGVRFFFEGLDQGLAPEAQWACMGPSTAVALQQSGFSPDFIGTGEPFSTAAAFQAFAQGQLVLFVGALRAQENLRGEVGRYAQVSTLAVYDNQPIANIPCSNAELLIFTSPMNARAYFAQNTLGKGQKLIAIGPSTSNTLKQLGFTEIWTPETPDEKAIAQLINSHFTNNPSNLHSSMKN